jgi:DNA-binding response OmpR family regulator
MVDIAVINSSEETAEAMQNALEFAGWSTTRGFIVDFKRGRADVESFLTVHDPRAVVWDIGIPYEENWAYYQAVRKIPCTEGRGFVVTSTNVPVLVKLVGAGTLAELTGNAGVVEILGKPFDLDELTAAVRRVWTGVPARG